MNSEQYFNEILTQIPKAVPGKMFGAQCAKMPNGKSGMMLKNDNLIIKMTPEDATKRGFKAFTPMEGRPMGGWYEIPFAQKENWKKFAEISCAEVAKLPPNSTKKKK